MPELPEVETIRLGLQRKIIGLKIKRVEVIAPKSFQNMTGKPLDFARGYKVLKVWRRAKILGIDLMLETRGPASSQPHSISSTSLRGLNGAPRSLSPLVSLLFHLKMTGQVIWEKNYELRIKKYEKRFIGGHPTEDMLGKLPNKHTRVIFYFSDGSKLFFNDQRRFGWIRVVNSSELMVNSSLQNLGPEPLEAGFTWKILKSNLVHHKSLPVKVALLDQKVVSGIGNIYASEACFNAGIDPRKKVGNLRDLEIEKLHKGIIKALRDGIKYGGSTKTHFVDAEGRKGYFLDYAFVYGKDKNPCKVCGDEIKKIQLGGRGTYWCRKCQAGLTSIP